MARQQSWALEFYRLHHIRESDLLIDRADDIVNVCEIKYSKANYAITKPYAYKQQKLIDALEHKQPDKKFHLTFVSVNPIEWNVYSDIVKAVVTADELFR